MRSRNDRPLINMRMRPHLERFILSAARTPITGDLPSDGGDGGDLRNDSGIKMNEIYDRSVLALESLEFFKGVIAVQFLSTISRFVSSLDDQT